jgi:hypothetical protein
MRPFASAASLRRDNRNFSSGSRLIAAHFSRSVKSAFFNNLDTVESIHGGKRCDLRKEPPLSSRAWLLSTNRSTGGDILRTTVDLTPRQPSNALVVRGLLGS